MHRKCGNPLDVSFSYNYRISMLTLDAIEHIDTRKFYRNEKHAVQIEIIPDLKGRIHEFIRSI